MVISKMKFLALKAFVFLAGIALTDAASAQGARDFKTLAELRNTNFYRLTCSDVNSEIQAHFYVEVADQRVTNLKILSLAPARSLTVFEYAGARTAHLRLDLGTQLQIHGENPGPYWSESLSVEVMDTPAGLQANLFYENGDSARVQREKMKCGATNYLLVPVF